MQTNDIGKDAQIGEILKKDVPDDVRRSVVFIIVRLQNALRTDRLDFKETNEEE